MVKARKAKPKKLKKEKISPTPKNSIYSYFTLGLFFVVIILGFAFFRIDKNQAFSSSPTLNYTPYNFNSYIEVVRTNVERLSKKDNAQDSGYCLDVPILMYHHIQPYKIAQQKGQTALTVDSDIFDKQMHYLSSRGYNTISADQLADALINHSSLPQNPIVITIDDGYKDNFIYAYPVVEKFNFIANIMIAAGLLEGSDFLSWDDLKTMVNSGKFYAYDHTWSHASLGGASDITIETEVTTARRQLEENLGRSVNIFAYPYGSQSQNVVEVLIKDGFIAAFSTIPGRIQCDSNIMSLRRIRIGNNYLSSYGL